MDIWDSLDNAAEANLSGSGLNEFYRYKESLKKDGHMWANDAELILSGFIWDTSEELEEKS